MLGFSCSLPIFICPAALARLGHPDGEMNLVKAAAKEDIIMGVRAASRDRVGRILTSVCRCQLTRAAQGTR